MTRLTLPVWRLGPLCGVAVLSACASSAGPQAAIPTTYPEWSPLDPTSDQRELLDEVDYESNWQASLDGESPTWSEVFVNIRCLGDECDIRWGIDIGGSRGFETDRARRDGNTFRWESRSYTCGVQYPSHLTISGDEIHGVVTGAECGPDVQTLVPNTTVYPGPIEPHNTVIQGERSAEEFDDWIWANREDLRELLDANP